MFPVRETDRVIDFGLWCVVIPQANNGKSLRYFVIFDGLVAHTGQARNYAESIKESAHWIINQGHLYQSSRER